MKKHTIIVLVLIMLIIVSCSKERIPNNVQYADVGTPAFERYRQGRAWL